MQRLRRIPQRFLNHPYGLTLGIFLTAAAATGVACVLFMWAFEWVSGHRLDAARIGAWCWVTTPALFLLSVELIRRVAPCADGAGIPQTIFAASHLREPQTAALRPLVSLRTMSVKIVALLVGVWACASTGREGPTVHVAACLFVSVVWLLRRVTKLSLDVRSAVVAGGAAGLAAAFNTPLAGVTFAIEELSTDYFANIKDVVLMAIIVAGLTAKSLTGEYTYFGRLADPSSLSLLAILLIGLLGGAGGALFSSALVEGRRQCVRLAVGRWRYLLPVLLAWAVLAVNAVSPMSVLGPGNKAAQVLVQGDFGRWAFSFPWCKMLATLCTYWSGIAGGIFAPCLSMGAGLGADVGWWMSAPVAGCALIGMTAFLAGAIQAPITSFVIIFEMTGHHQMLLPIMLAALLGFMTAKVLGAKHLYQALAASYAYLLPTPPPPTHTAH